MAARDANPAREHRVAAAPHAALEDVLRTIDKESVRQEFAKQGAFLYLKDFLPAQLTDTLVDAAATVQSAVNRNYLPGHKQGGSVSRHTLDELAPAIAELYRSPMLVRFLEGLAGERLQVSPADDPHAYALYFYTRPGDHIGWHYDTSYYAGRRYTLLLGVIDRSSCRLDYQLHTREPGVAVVDGSVRIPPGGLVFFDGDKLRHRITPLGKDEMRVSLTFEYVTDPKMHAGWRLISNMKDAVAYFGFRQVFRRPRGGPTARRRMNRAATWLLSAGIVLFIAVLASHDFSAVLATLSHAGWGLPFVALFHLLPLGVDAAAIVLLFTGALTRKSAEDGLLARWVGESANSLMPAGQLGGPVLMARFLARRGMAMDDAAAAITVSTTMQTFAQIMFAMVGVFLLGAEAGHLSQDALRTSALIACAFLAVQVGGFYLLQRRGMFSKLIGAVTRFWGKRDWSKMMTQARAIDRKVRGTYDRGGAVATCLLLNLLGWFVGVGEVYLIAWLLGTPVSWTNALLLESVGSAIRGAGFAIPGALGVQEGGYLLLAPLAGLPPSAGIALSLAKRARELLLGIPGLMYLHFADRGATR